MCTCIWVYAFKWYRRVSTSMSMSDYVCIYVHVTMARGVWPSACDRILFDSLRDWDHGRLGSRSGDFTLSSSGVSVGTVGLTSTEPAMAWKVRGCHATYCPWQIWKSHDYCKASMRDLWYCAGSTDVRRTGESSGRFFLTMQLHIDSLHKHMR